MFRSSTEGASVYVRVRLAAVNTKRFTLRLSSAVQVVSKACLAASSPEWFRVAVAWQHGPIWMVRTGVLVLQ